MDSLVKHGTMVTAADISKADVAIKDGHYRRKPRGSGRPAHR